MHTALRWLPFLAIGAAAQLNDSFVDACSQLPNIINIDNVYVNFTEYIAANNSISLNGVPAVCAKTAQQVATDLCRVYMTVATSNRSGLRLEAWLPRDYNGRFLSTGNGGLGGCVHYDDLAFGTQFGFATVGANNGHDGDTGQYFLNNEDVLEDFVYRSVVTGAELGKQVVDTFYDQGHNKSYYIGCSTGGRQGYKLVQDHPDIFDGVLAGAPAMNFVNLGTWGLYLYSLAGKKNSTTFLSTDQWAAVHEEIIRQCDAIDGAVDGIIEDTDLCQPIADALVCNSTTSSTSSTCLTGEQARAVNSIYTNFYGPDGKLYYPRLNPSGESQAQYVYFSGTPLLYSSDWYKYVVYNDSTWDPDSWTVADAKVALDQNPFNVQTFNADISAFRDAGGKLLSYHGTSDGIITSDDTKLYYRSVVETMNLSPSELDQFYRFFSISGMGHCGNGDGASYIGQGYATYLSSTPEDNLLLALVDWVEKGAEPEYVRGAKVSADGFTPEYFRKHCRYPRRNKYVGPGNYTDEDAWSCV
ncbi:hypothetical protein TruAng_000028 [Truncatella angustata]|nr:hypothetical protein TruAng_000028 [Truncatella angustata]